MVYLCCRSELLELEKLRREKAELQQTMDAQIAAVKSECERELEEVRVQVRRSSLTVSGVRSLTQSVTLLSAALCKCANGGRNNRASALRS
jgi:hypothetical protein